MVKKIAKTPIFLFLFLSAIVILSWFREGLVFGGGDTGLPLYNPKMMVSIASNIWWESLAPGIPVAQGLTSVPLLFFFSIFQGFGASPVVIQALLFFILLFLMGYGMYLLSLYIFSHLSEKSKYLLAISAGVFYLFNPYMMIQIWHRFIHNSMLFVAFLPFLVLTWLWWIRKRQLKFLLLFLIVNFLAVYVYGTIAFIVAIWTLLFFLTLLEAIIPWKGKKIALKLAAVFLVGIFFWFLTNSWWLIPTFSVSPALFSEQHSTDDSLSVLLDLSHQTTLPYIIRLINPFYLYWHADWGSIYQTPIFILISWLFVLIVMTGFIKGLKEKAYIIWSLLFLIVIFLGKGAASPFPFPYIFGFSHFFPLGVIRNPFEKLGILLPLIFAILFAVGLRYLLLTSIKRVSKSKTILFLTIFTFLHMIFLWPMFAGKLFGTLDKQNFVEVPQSYIQANEWIKQDAKFNESTSSGRILHLPLPQSEDVTYNWQYGYSGLEPSAVIFTALPSIARGLEIPRVKDALSGLSLVFHKPYSSNQAVVLKMLQDFSIKYIVLHQDIEWLGGQLYNPIETESILDKLEFLEKSERFDNLIVYKLKPGYFSPKIIISDNLELLNPSQKNLFWPWMVTIPSTQMISNANGQNSNIFNKTKTLIVLPDESAIVKNLEVPKFTGNLDNFNNIRLLPTSPLHFLIEIKEKLSLINKSKVEQQQWRVIFAEKRLVEMYKIKRMRELGLIDQKMGEELIISSMRRYERLLKEIFKEGLIIDNISIGVQQFSISDEFLKHISLLEEFGQSSGDIILLIKEYLSKNGLSPKYPFIDENGKVRDFRQLYIFNIPFKSTYEILMSNPQVKNIYPNNLSDLTFQINESIHKLQEEDKGNLMSFGKKEMESGVYQISIPRLFSTNLSSPLSEWTKLGNVVFSESSDTIEISSEKQSYSYIEGNINPAYGGDTYLFGFDLKILSGQKTRVQILQDTDEVNKKTKEVLLRFNDNHLPTNFDKNGWSHFEAIINLQPTTQRAKLKIQAEPWDDCLVVLSNKESCSDEKVRKQYNQPSKFIIKNINIVRLLGNEMFLSTSLSDSPVATPSGSVLEAKQINPSKYYGKVKIDKPTAMFFKESFNPGWELSLTSGKETYKPAQHIVGNLFSNAWLIEKTGEYNFFLNYNPQKFLTVGILLGALGWSILGLMVVLKYSFGKRTSKDEK